MIPILCKTGQKYCGNSSYLLRKIQFSTISIYDQYTESEWCEIEMIISQLILTIKLYQMLYGKMISILYKMGGKYRGNSSYLWI